MATRADLRSDLNTKILAIEDSGYGDFEFTDAELNTYLELSVARLYPHLYKKVSLLSQAVESYGTNDYYRVATEHAERVFLVLDSTEQEPIFAWQIIPGYISKLDVYGMSGYVDIFYYDAFALPTDDVTDVTVPDRWFPVVILGALIEALESRQDSGVRGDEPPIGNNVEIPLLDRLIGRYEQAKEDLALALPVVTV